jgi:hypothetical protein
MAYYSQDDYINLKYKNEQLQLLLDKKIREAKNNQNNYEDMFNKLQSKIGSLIEVNSQLRSLSELKESENDEIRRENYHLNIKINNLIRELEKKNEVIKSLENKENEFLLTTDKFQRKYSFIKEKYSNLKMQNAEKEKIINVFIFKIGFNFTGRKNRK